MFWSAVHYLSLLGSLAAGVMFLIRRDELASFVFIGSMAFGVITWIWAYFKRRAARCPLCKGTPLLNSGALPHGRAVRLPLLNHGVTATLSLIFKQEFRCMYCGSLYDMLKSQTSNKPSSTAIEESDDV